MRNIKQENKKKIRKRKEKEMRKVKKRGEGHFWNKNGKG